MISILLYYPIYFTGEKSVPNYMLSWYKKSKFKYLGCYNSKLEHFSDRTKKVSEMKSFNHTKIPCFPYLCWQVVFLLMKKCLTESKIRLNKGSKRRGKLEDFLWKLTYFKDYLSTKLLIFSFLLYAEKLLFFKRY